MHSVIQKTSKHAVIKKQVWKIPGYPIISSLSSSFGLFVQLYAKMHSKLLYGETEVWYCITTGLAATCHDNLANHKEGSKNGIIL